MKLPVGALVPERQVLSPQRVPLHGQYTHLQPLRGDHVPGLYKHLGGPENLWRWTYLLIDGFPTLDDAAREVQKMVDTPDMWYYVVMSGPESDPTAEPVGMTAYLNQALDHRRIEVGCVLFSEALQRTMASTEANMLLLRYAFDELGFQRVEWKANSLNKPSRAAAIRLGYTFDGVFRKHQVFKGRYRDTAWFGIIEDDWPVIKRGLELWLDEKNFEQGKQVRGLLECRELATLELS